MNSTHRIQVIAIALALIVGTYVLGCIPEGGGGPTGPSGAALATVQLTPAVNTLDAFGAVVQYSAVALDAVGDTITGLTFTWSSSATGVATVSASGLATAVANGTATISAMTGGVSGSASLTVAQQAATVEVTPAITVLTSLGATQQLGATASDANGNPVPGVTFLWASSDPTVATVGSSGLATAVGQGAVTITADAQGVIGSAVLNVIVQVSAVVITPATAALSALAATVQLSAAAQDANGNPLTGVQFSWGSSNAAAATVDASGLVTAQGNGTATLTATAGLASGAASVSVDQVVSATLSSVLALPASVVADGTTTVTITVAAKDANGYGVGGKTVALAATGLGNTFTQPAPTSASGLTTGTLASNTAETKTISATVNPGAADQVSLAQTPTVEFAPFLAFIIEPSSTTASDAFAPAVQVGIVDGAGNLSITYTDPVTLTIGNNPAGGTLWGTSTVSPGAGIATFSDLSIDVAATGYTLVATSAALTIATSPVFDVLSGFVSASTLASTVSNCDECSQNVPIGFTFNFFGAPFTSINVVSNGYASFVSTFVTFFNDPIPDPSDPQGFVAPFWDDLDMSATSGSGDVFTSTTGLSPNRRFIVEYRNVDFWATFGLLNFEFILYEGSSLIEFVYGSLSSSSAGRESGGSATVGIENATGTVGLQVGFDTIGTVASGQRMIFSFDGFNYSRVR